MRRELESRRPRRVGIYHPFDQHHVEIRNVAPIELHRRLHRFVAANSQDLELRNGEHDFSYNLYTRPQGRLRTAPEQLRISIPMMDARTTGPDGSRGVHVDPQWVNISPLRRHDYFRAYEVANSVQRGLTQALTTGITQQLPEPAEPVN